LHCAFSSLPLRVHFRATCLHHSCFTRFYFQRSRPNIIRPSFPTRRSSDLSRTSPASKSFSSPIISPPAVTILYITHYCQYKIIRSEEHTSELQSRFDIVCRLVLENKHNMIAAVSPQLSERFSKRHTECSPL